MTTGTYLDRILPRTREDLETRKAALPLPEILSRLADTPPALDFVGALSEDRLHLIAEVKRASPSKGDFVTDIDVEVLARTYAENGASAISVLTDRPFFRGSLADLAAVREVAAPAGVPLLRKDFIVEPYQVYEARLWGADAVLLIAACLPDGLLRELQDLAGSLGMAALIEVHNEDELDRVLEAKPRLVGINNRDLRTFVTDLSTTDGLAPRVPRKVKVVSESGIASRHHARLMRAAGADAILVGEALITAPDTAEKVRELSSIHDQSMDLSVTGFQPPAPESPAGFPPPR